VTDCKLAVVLKNTKQEMEEDFNTKRKRRLSAVLPQPNGLIFFLVWAFLNWALIFFVALLPLFFFAPYLCLFVCFQVRPKKMVVVR
jgi:hypothetical protein